MAEKWKVNLNNLVHIEQAKGLPFKTADYLSMSGEKIFNSFVKDKEIGFFGLPTSQEVC